MFSMLTASGKGTSQLQGWCSLALATLFFAGLNPNLRASVNSSPRQLVITAQPGYVTGVPVLVRVDLRLPDGRPDWAQWDAAVVLESDSPAVSLNPAQLTLRNGRGSVLVAVSGTSDFTLTARFGDVTDRQRMTFRGAEPVMVTGGALPGSATTWSGIIRVTNDLTVPSGHTLTIQSNTLVLLEGVASGTSAPDILVSGSIESLGTADEPVVITAADPSRNWGQIRHNSAAPSQYRYTHITKAGRAPGEGHTGTAPAIRPSNSTLRFDQCVISDLTDPTGTTIGKIMESSSGSDITLVGCQLARARMGPEITRTAILCEDTYLMDMRGNDDDDAIYIHTQSSGQRALLSGCVVYGMDDDGVDTLGATVTITNCLIRDVFDKGVSVFSGEFRMLNCLNINCGIGISTKTGNDETVRTHITQSTIIGRNRGIAAENKGGDEPDATVLYFVTNSIIDATVIPANTVYTDYDPSEITIVYSDTVSEAWPGIGNLMTNPRFVNAAQNDYHLAVGSPCIDAGHPAFARDADGSRADMGYFAFTPPPPVLRFPAYREGTFSFELNGYTNRTYAIEASPHGTNWTVLDQVDLMTSPLTIEDTSAGVLDHRFYRVRMGP